MTYTCVGDTVNVAAHLEAHTKVLRRAILIDANTRAGLGDKSRVESHGPAQLKTKARPWRSTRSCIGRVPDDAGR